jgi:hypothetical protein
VPVVSVEKNIEMRGKPRYEVNVFEYPRPEFDDLITVPEIKETLEKLTKNTSLEELKRRYEAEAPKTIKVSYGFSTGRDIKKDDPGRDNAITRSKNLPESRRPIDVSELIRELREASSVVGKPKNKLRSVDPDKPFLAFEWKIAVAPTPKALEDSTTPEAEAEDKHMLEGDDLTE